jgi:NAD(P)-dependent dehydrogenase (short-subunit alcohol dehydrogenase family)
MAYEKFNLSGKTALITGGAGLLGIEHASALLESGAKVVLTDINTRSLKSAQKKLSKNFEKRKLIIKIMDVTSKASVYEVAKELIESNVNIDILINNAAIDPKVKGDKGLLETSRLENFSIEEWDLQIAVGLKGAFICSQIFGTHMSKNGKGGVILNISSDLSVFSPDQRIYRKAGLSEETQPVKPVTYSIIKAGLIGLTRYLATYWLDKNIRCNALSPGGIYQNQNDEFVKRLNSLIPLGRMASIDEYRATVQYLCSDASNYMNGQNIIVDGGRSVW